MKTLTKAIAALSAIPVAGIIALTGAGSAFAITCAPGYVPITFNGIQSCSPTGTGGVGGGNGGSIGGGGSTAPGQAGGIVSGGGYHPPAYVPPTPVKVSAPVVTVSRVGYDRMTVSWKKPSVIGALTGYKITVKQGNQNH